jgi:hypothetical protein
MENVQLKRCHGTGCKIKSNCLHYLNRLITTGEYYINSPYIKYHPIQCTQLICEPKIKL